MGIKEKLEASRKELLDLSLRNPLLNYRLLKSRGLEAVKELPEEVFRILVLENKSMTFVPAAPKEEEEEQEEEYLQPADELYKDLKIQTGYSEKELQSRLLSTYLSARTYIEEQGVNVLFLALGMLNWKESQSSEKVCKAPLILIPVELNRSNVRERFTLSYTEDDIQSNISLYSKLSGEFAIKIPLITDKEDIDIRNYFIEIENAIVSQKNWSVDKSAIAIGFFSFAKFLMYKDLDISTWPEEINPLKHTILNSLLDKGFKEKESEIGDDEHLDKHINPRDAFHVVETDSSQALAILDANSGRNLVIQGPPGTGKSQTITNIIAECIGKGRKVLFVSEKMAALEVVKRRLSNIGLGDACLELHSNKTNKKTLLAELERVLELGEPRVANVENSFDKAAKTRDYLNEYCDAVNTPIGCSGITPYFAYGEVLRIKREFDKSELKPPKLDVQDMETWQKSDYGQKLSLIRDLKAHLANMGIPSKHPFWGCGRDSFLPSDKESIIEALKDLQSVLGLMLAASQELADRMLRPSVSCCSELKQLIATAQRILESPDVGGINIKSDGWLNESDKIMKLVEAGAKYTDIHKKFDSLLVPEAWDYDVFTIRQTLFSYKDKWWRFVSGSYRQANNMLTGLFKNKVKLDINQRLELVESILECQRIAKQVEQNSELGKSLFNNLWKGIDTDWQHICSITQYVIKLYKDIYSDSSASLPLFKEAVDYLAENRDKEMLVPHLKDLKEFEVKYYNLANTSVDLLKMDLTERFGSREGLFTIPFDEMALLLKTWINRIDDIQQMVVYNHFSSQLRKEKLEGILILAKGWDYGAKYLDSAFSHQYYQVLLNKVFTERKVLAAFERGRHEHAISEFCSIDKSLLEINRARLAHDHWKLMPKASSTEGQLGVLLWEFQKKSRHLPIRQLMHKAGNVIQAIKPVMMMSPLSIANFIEPESVKFDVVIFDEASQVRPVEAFGAILRGSQSLVVGDSCQMPPTSFFDFISGASEEEEENSVSDVESILGLFVAQGCPQRMLRWHYRSRHESLIAVSNHELYRDKLVIFPSAGNEDIKTGLVYHYLPHTAYDRGKSRTNIEEAKTVAEEIMKHAKSNPQLTLGVAAFSIPQMQAIIDQLEMLRKKDPSCEEFFQSHKEEPFFIKNLENVQGDERDVIFISIGYGKTAEGYLSMEFGPLNREGGERRLNVLITRARQRCEVFTNLTADDIDLSRTGARGVQCLKTFLAYAKDGILDIPVETGKEADSPFEEEVYNALTAMDYTVKRQVGCAGFFIDLAIVDPERPGRYLIGIECDGESYHSARSARDRDRLRQSVLEDKGWTIHRIWSTDWFRNPQREIERLVDSIGKAENAIKIDENADEDFKHEKSTIIERISNVIKEDNDLKVEPYKFAQINGIYTDLMYQPEALSKYIVEVVKTESPVHTSEVLKRLLSAAGLKRSGSSIQEKFDEAVRIAVRKGSISQKKDFLWHKDMQKPVLRDRKDLPSALKKLEYVDDEELALAINTVIGRNFGMENEQAPAAACHLLGFGRINESMQDRIEGIVEDMVKTGNLNRQGNNLFVP